MKFASRTKLFRLVFFVFSTVLLLLILCESVVTFVNVKSGIEKTTITQFSAAEPINLENKLYVTFTKAAKWEDDDLCQVAMFDGYFANTTDRTFTNWTVKIRVPETSEIISFWNCEFKIEDSYLIINPDTEPYKTIKSGERKSFGFVLSSDEEYTIRTITLTGNNKINLFRDTLFLVFFLCIVGVLMVVVSILIVHFVMNKQLNDLRIQNKRDAMFIEQTMKTFIQFIDAKDEYTRGHSARVAIYAKSLAKELGYNEKRQREIYYMGLMHDIGKLTVPDEILNKSSKLNDDEWEIIKLHTTNGARLLKDFTILPELKDAVLYHHERYDGKGYVHNLKGEEIPLCARIICVADSFDAMHTNRCYRLKYSDERIIMELERCSGKQFDPKIVPAMIRLIQAGAFTKITDTYDSDYKVFEDNGTEKSI